jgi:hypothetical protein
MHDSYPLPWNVHIIQGQLYLRSTECKIFDTEETCSFCAQLHTNVILEGILARLKTGTHENSPHHFQPIAGLRKIIAHKTRMIDILRVERLNAVRKLAGKLGALDNQKRLIMAVAYGGIKRRISG